jgi:hypothetical protein
MNTPIRVYAVNHDGAARPRHFPPNGFGLRGDVACRDQAEVSVKMHPPVRLGLAVARGFPGFRQFTDLA